MAAIRKTPMGPVTPVGRLDPTFAERALVNSEIAKVKRQKERARVQLPLPRGSWTKSGDPRSCMQAKIIFMKETSRFENAT